MLRQLAIALGVLVCAAALPAGARAAVAYPDVSYDSGSPPADPNLNSLDVYTPDGAAAGDSRPVIVYVHGGAWRVGDKANQIRDKVDLFTGAGYVFVSLNYRLSPADPDVLDPNRIKYPDHPADVAEAIGWISRNIAAYGGDPSRIGLIGHSAGAHLVSLVSTDPSLFTARGVEPWQVVGTVSLDSDAYVVEDRIDELSAAGKNTYYNAFGTPAENAATGSWAAASPQLHADGGDPRFLLVTQTNPRRLDDTRAMATALGQDPAGVFVAPYDHEGINDAVGSATDPAGETAAIMSFYAERLAAAVDPKAKLRKHPPKLLRSTRKRAKVRFKLASPERDARFECRLDSRKLKPCKAKPSFAVGRGRHAFRYRALLPNGRPGPVKTFSFRVTLAG